MTQKKTLTKNEAREWLRERFITLLSQQEADQAIAHIKRLGFEFYDGRSYGPVYTILAINSREQFALFSWSIEPIELSLSDLLSIEIVEEPDHRAMLEEAVKLLEECCPIMHRLTPDVKARSQINKIEQFLKANRP